MLQNILFIIGSDVPVVLLQNTCIGKKKMLNSLTKQDVCVL